MRSLRPTRVRGLPLAGEAVGFDDLSGEHAVLKFADAAVRERPTRFRVAVIVRGGYNL